MPRPRSPQDAYELERRAKDQVSLQKRAREALRRNGHTVRYEPYIIAEDHASRDRDIVDAAAVGSVYLLKNGQQHVKLAYGWVDARATRRDVIDGDLTLAGLGDEALALLEQVAERDLLEAETYLVRLRDEAKRRSRGMT